MGGKFSKLKHFWSEDRSLSVLLLLLLLYIFVLVPAPNHGRTGEILIKIIYSLILFGAILSVLKQKKFKLIVSIFAIIGFVITWLNEISTGISISIANDISVILFTSFFAIAILIKTFQPGDITFQRIQGSIVVLILFGAIFAYAFHVIYLIAGESSFNNIRDANVREFLYFSFTTLTTTGFGDITPGNTYARALANLEGLIGLLYPAILIGRLVSMEYESSKHKRERNK
jgi:Ion channel